MIGLPNQQGELKQIKDPQLRSADFKSAPATAIFYISGGGGLNGATGKFMGSYMSLGIYMRLAGQVHSPLNFRGAPYYGEIPYAGRMIVSGFNAGIKKRK